MPDVELEHIGSYTISNTLSVSSTSSLYQSKVGRKDVIIKRINVPLKSPQAREAFLKRAGHLKKLKHRSIVDTQTFDFDGDFGYLVQEYKKGETLRQHFAAGKQRKPAELRPIVLPIADALHYAHIQNTLHGNLSPGSILIDERNNPYITDFALSTPEMTLDDIEFALPYMAPEQLQGLPVAASDQYALAVMIYEWLCGRRPYEASERELLLEQQTKTTFPKPSSINSNISSIVESVLMQALSFKAEERFPTMQDFGNAYLKALMGVAMTPAPKPPVLAAQRKIVSPPVPVANEDASAVGAKSIEPVVSPTQKPKELPKVAVQVAKPAQSEVSPFVLEAERPKKRVAPVSDSRLQAIVESDLSQDGILSQRLSGYEERPAQLEMASVVARALNQNVPAIIEAATGTGKALDVETPIPTPTGWKRMGDLVEGDYVFDEKGYPTRVTKAFDVMHNRQCYEVVFSDGSSLIADAEHEWASYTSTDRKHSNQSKTSTYTAKNFVTSEKLVLLDQLIASSKNDTFLSKSEAVALVGGHQWSVLQAAHKIEALGSGKRPTRYPGQILLTEVRGRLARDLSEQRREERAYTLVTTQKMAETLTIGSAKRAKHAIRVAAPLSLPDIELPIKPYFLGFWLGDGSSYSNQITTADPDIIAEIEKDGYTVRPLKSPKIRYAVDDENGKSVSRWQPGMTGRLRALNLLHNKHIPAMYLRASEQQRRALLAGLLDTDGTVNRCGAIEFTTTSQRLADDTYELLCSLGFRTSVRYRRAKCNGKDCGPKWTLAFTTNTEVFRLERKRVTQKERLLNYNSERNRFRYVVAINEVPSRPVRCIQVESESHLYLAGRAMIPTHNSLAYLVPAVRSGKTTIISTANKALQEQLFYKDIPFVQQHIKHFEAALVKGVGNYVCLDRLESERTGMQFYVKNTDFKRLVDITNDPDADFTGDFETLGFQLPGDIRSKVATDNDQCAWSKCNYFADCYVRQMRENAALAQVIVVNHTLLLLDAAIGGFLLPERDVVILDEAHHLEEEATRSFTITIGPMQIQTLLNQRLLRNHSQLSLQSDAMNQSNLVWARLAQVADPGFKGRANLEAPLEEGLKLSTIIGDLADSLRKQRPKDLPDKEGQLYDKLLKRTQNLADNTRIVFSVAQPTKFVYYVERVQTAGQRGGIQLQVSAAPLDVTSWLQEKLFKKCNVICTSATLATIGPNPMHPEEKGPNFGYFRRRVGLEKAVGEPDEVLERILPLTFDYESNALLYIPRDLPEPTYGAGSDDYMKAIAREMYKLVKASRGRAFLLFSSKRMLERAYELMSPHLPYTLLKQGDMTRLELTRRFREEEDSVLFGLKSFWEGVDIAGDALSLVVIDKLPFDPPDDPVHEARVAQMKAAGENWFGTYVLPQAVLRLKQGIGRLLRTREDRGVMAILDTRLYTKGYGKMVLNALPPARRTMSIREVEHFFAEET